MAEPRLERFTPERLDNAAKSLYDAITQGDRGTTDLSQRVPLVGEDGALEGPFNAMLTSPAIGNALQELGTSLRFRGSLSSFTREATILLVAAKNRCEFERRAHEPIAASAGISPDAISKLGEGELPEDISGADAVAMSSSRRLIFTGTLDAQSYGELVDAVGIAGVFELVTLVGYYSTLANILAVFEVN